MQTSKVSLEETKFAWSPSGERIWEPPSCSLCRRGTSRPLWERGHTCWPLWKGCRGHPPLVPSGNPNAADKRGFSSYPKIASPLSSRGGFSGSKCQFLALFLESQILQVGLYQEHPEQVEVGVSYDFLCLWLMVSVFMQPVS